MILFDLVDAIHTERQKTWRRHAVARGRQPASARRPRPDSVRVEGDGGAVMLTREGVTRIAERQPSRT